MPRSKPKSPTKSDLRVALRNAAGELRTSAVLMQRDGAGWQWAADESRRAFAALGMEEDFFSAAFVISDSLFRNLFPLVDAVSVVQG